MLALANVYLVSVLLLARFKSESDLQYAVFFLYEKETYKNHETFSCKLKYLLTCNFMFCPLDNVWLLVVTGGF